MTNLENAVYGDGSLIRWTVYFRVFEKSDEKITEISEVFDKLLDVRTSAAYNHQS